MPWQSTVQGARPTCLSPLPHRTFPVRASRSRSACTLASCRLNPLRRFSLMTHSEARAEAAGVGSSATVHRASCGPVFGDQLSNLRNEFSGDFHDGLICRLKRGLVLCHSFFFCLRFIVDKDPFDALLVPSGGKFILVSFRSAATCDPQ